jgi:hypothetical protein
MNRPTQQAVNMLKEKERERVREGGSFEMSETLRQVE